MSYDRQILPWRVGTSNPELYVSVEEPKTPDILVELREAGHTRYAVVIDAKYTASPEKYWKEASGYFNIAVSRTRERVAAQIWLAYPGTPTSIRRLRGSQEDWNTGVPGRVLSVGFQGELPLLPPNRDQPIGVGEMQPGPQALSFIDDLLGFLVNAG